jgi:2-keto-4-pentenoate hydratase/2-oxohepta-3-ene-1,7-dioic acid hydratase in catechol pathway
MRLALYRHGGETRIGVPQGDALVSLHRAAAWLLRRRGDPAARARADLLAPDSVVAFLAAGEEARAFAEECLAEVARADAAELVGHGVLASAADVEWLPTLLGAERFICVGRNYLEHVQEAGAAVPEYPVLFPRSSIPTRSADFVGAPESSVVGHEQPLLRPAVSTEFDFEGELVAVIGRACRYVPRAQALDVVGGYTILQEGSIRDWQLRAPTQMAGKNFTATGSLGPWLVTPDELPDPAALHVTTRVNGETMQDADTSGMLFDIPFLIEYLTQFMPLAPGDVIATGTPPGVGFARRPPVFLRAGDRVEVEIPGLGTLANPVVDESSAAEPFAASAATWEG